LWPEKLTFTPEGDADRKLVRRSWVNDWQQNLALALYFGEAAVPGATYWRKNSLFDGPAVASQAPVISGEVLKQKPHPRPFIREKPGRSCVRYGIQQRPCYPRHHQGARFGPGKMVAPLGLAWTGSGFVETPAKWADHVPGPRGFMRKEPFDSPITFWLLRGWSCESGRAPSGEAGSAIRGIIGPLSSVDKGSTNWTCRARRRSLSTNHHPRKGREPGPGDRAEGTLALPIPR